MPVTLCWRGESRGCGLDLPELLAEGHLRVVQRRGEVLRGPEDSIHGGMGWHKGCAEKWGEAGAESRDLREERVSRRKLGCSARSPNQVQ